MSKEIKEKGNLYKKEKKSFFRQQNPKLAK
jgi:hypothetical protein